MQPRRQLDPVRASAWWAYEHAPLQADAVFQLGRRYILPLLRYAVPLARVSGMTRSGQPGSMLVAGSGQPLLAVQRLFFAGEIHSEHLGFCPTHALPRTLLALGGSDTLILARMARPLARRLFDHRFLRVPDLVDVWIDVRDRDRMLRSMSQTMRRNARAIPADGYSWSEARDDAAFERFYDHYYLPFIMTRHAELAVVRERPVLRRYFRQGGILWIRQGGEEVAGLLLHDDDRVATHHAVGTRRGDLEARHRGALNATNLFGIDLAARRGLQWVNLGGCMPSPLAGSLRHKRGWGGELRERADSHHDLLIRWPSFTSSVARFLTETPLIVRDHGGLAALAGVEGDAASEPGAAQRLWRRWRMPGLRRLYVLSELGWRPWPKGHIPPDPATLWLSAANRVEDVLVSARDAAILAREAGS